MAEKNTAGYQVFTQAESARSKGMWAGALSRATIPGLSGIYIVPHSPEAADTALEGTAPAHTAPADTAPADTAPADTAPADTAPADTAPIVGSPPVDTAPIVGPPPAAVHYEIREIERDHTPAVLKIIDEALVNASDHQKEHARWPKAIDRVARIQLDFNPITGRFSVENDGPGIPAEIHAGASETMGRTVYVPEVAFAVFLAGRNMVKPPDSVKGGINGVGAKLINVHSEFFAVETVANGLFYRQIFRSRMRTREDPQIFATRSAGIHELTDAQKRPHTRITFLPAYNELGYPLDPQGHLAPQDAADIEAWCRWRMFVLAAYVGPKTAVIFNGVVCPTTSAKALAALAVAHDPAAIVMGCVAKATAPPYSAHPWDIAVAVVPGAKRFTHISVINGVHCSKGAHITYFKKIFNEAVGAKLARAMKSKDKKSSVTDTCRQLFLVIIGALPGADWGGQRKDELQVVESLLHPYTIPATVLGKIAGTIADGLLRLTEKGVRGQQKRVEAEKYTPARKAGGRDSARCALLAAEGDSAIALLRAGLTLGPAKNPGGPSFETHGIISLGGVIMNALKKVTPVVTAGGETILIRTEQLRENKVLKALGAVLGLDYTCRYETPAEVARLRYGSIIVCTDQDLDGTGKILPLVLVWFHVFWPKLIACGYVKRFMTPVVRVYAPARDQTEPREFYYETEYLRDAPPGVPKYYKGLASHDDTEVVRMFHRFAETVYTFTLDDTAAELFKVYFGDQPALRKTALATPVVFPTSEETREIHLSRRIPCSVQMQVDAKAYKLDDIQRKIPRLLDGIPVARRKVLAGALKRFSSENREIKVFQLGGYIAEKMFYHHGDASLNSTIVGMAQRFPGALQYPCLTGIGQFGSRHFGGGDAGSPRYINVRLAAPFAKAMYPAADSWMLPHVFEDGERAQPEYFVPVLPMALLESFDIPSEGWRHRSFARRLPDVVALTLAYLGRGGDAAANELVARVAAAAEAAPPGTGLEALPCPQGDAALLRERLPLNVSLRGYGDHLGPEERAELVRPCKGYPHSFGWYYPEHNAGGKAGVTVLRVTELPLHKTTQSFLKGLEKSTRAEYIDDVQDYSSDAKIDVRVKLVPGAWDEICAKFGTSDSDALEEFLLLRTTLKPFLNYYGRESGVVEFGDDYHAVFFQWAPVRRDLYRHRLEREAVLLGLKIRLEREILRYISIARELDLAHKADEAAACAALAERRFAPFAATVLHEPAYTPTAELVQLATRGECVSYDYILSLRERDLVQTAASHRTGKINAMVARLAEIESLLVEHPFAGASVWASEIENLVAVINRGEKTNWRF